MAIKQWWVFLKSALSKRFYKRSDEEREGEHHGMLFFTFFDFGMGYLHFILKVVDHDIF